MTLPRRTPDTPASDDARPHFRWLIGASVFALLAGIFFLVMLVLWRQELRQAQWEECYGHLLRIDLAKDRQRMENKLPEGSDVRVPELVAILSKRGMPVCPTGGKYRVGAIGEDPRCSRHGGLRDPEIHVAAAGGDIAAIRRLLKRGADVNARASFAWTPLLCAAFADEVPTAMFLLKRGADPHAATSKGETALDLTTSETLANILRNLPPDKTHGPSALPSGVHSAPTPTIKDSRASDG